MHKLKLFILFVILSMLFYTKSQAFDYTAGSAAQIYSSNVNSMLVIKTQDSTGSGVILKDDGTFVTCYHVIANADFIKATTKDGSTYNVNGFRYINPVSDIAVLNIDAAKHFTPIKINNYNPVNIGEKIYAISNPQGLQFVFSDGMINQYCNDYLQFSAPISTGSSGGALLNSSGNLLGIITSQMNPSISQNINFALPNHFFTSQINNPVIRNTRNFKWSDFIIANADKEQFKLYTGYAFSNKNFNMLYKYLKTLSKRNDVPPECYPMMGYFALLAYDKENSEEYLNDAVQWYNRALVNKLDTEASLFALSYLYARKNDDTPLLKVFIRLREEYPESYFKLIGLMTQIGKCSTTNPECSRTVTLDFLNYLGKITTLNVNAELPF